MLAPTVANGEEQCMNAKGKHTEYFSRKFGSELTSVRPFVAHL